MKKLILVLVCIILILPSISMAFSGTIKFPDTDFENNVSDFLSRYNSFIMDYAQTNDSCPLGKISYKSVNIDNDSGIATCRDGRYSINLDGDDSGKLTGFRVSVTWSNIDDKNYTNEMLTLLAFFSGCMNGLDPELKKEDRQDFIQYLIEDCEWEYGEIDQTINGFSYDAFTFAGFVNLSANKIME